jgi:DNA-nicking Smr family endonuclease
MGDYEKGSTNFDPPWAEQEEPVAIPIPVVIPIIDEFDLHTISDRDFRDVAIAYLEEAHQLGYRRVRLIHGRGTGTRRAIIRQMLSQHPLVGEFFDATPDSGGWGATVVLLKP